MSWHVVSTHGVSARHQAWYSTPRMQQRVRHGPYLQKVVGRGNRHKQIFAMQGDMGARKGGGVLSEALRGQP